jgi:hypothetical protein
VTENDTDNPNGTEAEQPWARNRRLRQAELDAANAHGRDLLERYGHADTRPRVGVVGYARLKARRRGR